MSQPRRSLVINQTVLSGTILGTPEVRKVGKNRYPILTFEAETVEAVGEGNRVETLHWRGKCFGHTAEALKAQLRKGLEVLVRGRWSGYQAPKGKKSPIPEITVKELALVPPTSVVFEAQIEEGSADRRAAELQEDLS